MVKNVTISSTLWQTTAQFAHFGVACAIMQAVRHHASLRTAVIMLAVGIVAAAGKEGWYDQKYETADERGSSPLDFACYVLGLVVGFFV